MDTAKSRVLFSCFPKQYYKLLNDVACMTHTGNYWPWLVCTDLRPTFPGTALALG